MKGKYLKKISKDYLNMDRAIGKMLAYGDDESLKFKFCVKRRKFIYFKIQFIHTLFGEKK